MRSRLRGNHVFFYLTPGSAGKEGKNTISGVLLKIIFISTFQTILIPLLQFALVPSSLQPPVSQTQMNSYHLILPLETPDRVFKKKRKQKNNKNTHEEIHFHLPSRAPMVPDCLDNIPLQDQISRVLRVAEKTAVVMVEYDDTLHDDQPHHYKSTVLDIHIQHFAEADDTRSVVPDTSMQGYHVQNSSNESRSETQ